MNLMKVSLCKYNICVGHQHVMDTFVRLVRWCEDFFLSGGMAMKPGAHSVLSTLQMLTYDFLVVASSIRCVRHGSAVFSVGVQCWGRGCACHSDEIECYCMARRLLDAAVLVIRTFPRSRELDQGCIPDHRVRTLGFRALRAGFVSHGWQEVSIFA